MKKILIIGGMGPQASLTLHEKILQAASKRGAIHGDDFPLIVHVSIPVPEFIDNDTTKTHALDIIRSSLYCLWQRRFYPRSYCM